MQKELSSLIKLLRTWIKKNKVLDIVIFGSYVKGKIKPKDVDVCILIENRLEKESLDLVDSLSNLVKFDLHISILTISDFLSGTSLSRTLIKEGISVKSAKPFSFGFSSKSLFVYSLKKFSSSKRVKFHYMLKGRYGSEGVLKSLNASFLGTGSIIVESRNEDTLRQIFDSWGVDYSVMHILVG